MLKFSAYGKSFLTYINSARPRDIQPLGARILQIRGFELGPKYADFLGYSFSEKLFFSGTKNA